jgi:hypothetical protein
MKLLRSLGGALSLAVLLGLLVSSVPAGAQTLTQLNLERSLALNNILTTIAPQGLSTAALAAIAAGALDVREQVNYNTATSSLTSTIFVVPTGSPNPTPLGQLPTSSFVAQVTMLVDRIYITSNPAPAVRLVGTVNQSTATPYGNYLGNSESFSFGYTTDTPPKINNVEESFSGAVVLYSASSSGTFTITRPSSGGGGSTGVAISVNGVTGLTPTFTTTLNQIILDASASTSSNPGALTFSYVFVTGSGAISFGTKSSIANVQLGSGKLVYTIKLTVTDSTGVSSVATITINYI